MSSSNLSKQYTLTAWGDDFEDDLASLNKSYPDVYNGTDKFAISRGMIEPGKAFETLAGNKGVLGFASIKSKLEGHKETIEAAEAKLKDPKDPTGIGFKAINNKSDFIFYHIYLKHLVRYQKVKSSNKVLQNGAFGQPGIEQKKAPIAKEAEFIEKMLCDYYQTNREMFNESEYYDKKSILELYSFNPAEVFLKGLEEMTEQSCLEAINNANQCTEIFRNLHDHFDQQTKKLQAMYYAKKLIEILDATDELTIPYEKIHEAIGDNGFISIIDDLTDSPKIVTIPGQGAMICNHHNMQKQFWKAQWKKAKELKRNSENQPRLPWYTRISKVVKEFYNKETKKVDKKQLRKTAQARVSNLANNLINSNKNSNKKLNPNHLKKFDSTKIKDLKEKAEIMTNLFTLDKQLEIFIKQNGSEFFTKIVDFLTPKFMRGENKKNFFSRWMVNDKIFLLDEAKKLKRKLNELKDEYTQSNKASNTTVKLRTATAIGESLNAQFSIKESSKFMLFKEKRQHAHSDFTSILIPIAA